MKSIKIRERKLIAVERQEANFDRACDAARSIAMGMFGCSYAGHLDNVEDSDRSTDWVVIEFLSYRNIASMGGESYIYEFFAYVDREDEEFEANEDSKHSMISEFSLDAHKGYE